MSARARLLPLASLTLLALAHGAPGRAQDHDLVPRPQTRKARAAASPAPRGAGVAPLRDLERPPALRSAPGAIWPLKPVPAREMEAPVLLRGGTLHPVSGPALENASILLAEGKIAALGRDLAAPPGARVFDIPGLHVYPSLIAADTLLGLVEIGAVRATRDYVEVGEINPNVRAEVAVNPDSLILPVTRSNGVLVAVTAPRSGLIAGTGAVLELDGWTWQDMTLTAPSGLYVNWPRMSLDYRADAKPGLEKQRQERDARVQKIRDAFEEARAYLAGRAEGAPRKDADVKWDALAKALAREIPVVVYADSLLEIQAALAFGDEQNLRLVLAPGRDAPLAAAELARRQVPVLVGNVLDVGREWEAYDLPFQTPKLLADAGVSYCITDGAGGAANARNLPYVAAKAVGFGLSPEEALRAITLYPARIFGLDARLGSLEVGKDATLFVSDGDPLDGRSNVLRSFIRGRELDLSDRHKQLYERFRLKPRRGEE